MVTLKATYRPLLPILLLSCLFMGSCEQRDALQEVKYSGTLRVLTRNSPTTYYIDKSGPAGFEYTLTQLFARELGAELQIESRHDLDALQRGLRRGEGDFVAAGLNIKPGLEQDFNFSAPYETVQPLVVYLAGKRRPRKPEDLMLGSLTVQARSSHIRILESLRENPAGTEVACDG